MKLKNSYLCKCVHTYILIQKYATENIINRLPANKSNLSFWLHDMSRNHFMYNFNGENLGFLTSNKK